MRYFSVLDLDLDSGRMKSSAYLESPTEKKIKIKISRDNDARPAGQSSLCACDSEPRIGKALFCLVCTDGCYSLDVNDEVCARV